MFTHRFHFLIIFMVSLVLLSFELLLTRIFSVIMWYHFAFLAISIAMFGICLGSMAVSLGNKWKNQASVPIFEWALFFFPLAILGASFLLFRIPFNPLQLDASNIFYLVIILCITLIPFIFGGVILASIYRKYTEDSARLYALDLTGAAFACISTLLFLDIVGAPTALIIISILALIVHLIYERSTGKPSKRIIFSGLILTFISILCATNHRFDWLSVVYSKGKQETGILYSAWNSLSRVCVFDANTKWVSASHQVKTPAIPELPRVKKTVFLKKRQETTETLKPRSDLLELVIDSSAGTYIRPFRGSFAIMASDINPLFSLVYRIRPVRKSLIIGPGGGQDVIGALAFGVRDITAVEINPLVINAVNNVFGEFSGHVYSQPQVRCRIDDGRHFIRTTDETYDVIQATLIDTWAATAAGAYALSENSLYTIEAFQEYLAHLEKDGFLSFSRFYFNPPRQSLRLVGLAREGLISAGVEPVENSVIVARKGQVSTVLVKKGAFTANEIDSCLREVADCEGQVVYYPGSQNASEFRELLTTHDVNRFYRNYIFDVTPPTDNRPFFFHLLKPSQWFRFDRFGGQKHLNQASYILLVLFIGACIIASAVLVISLLAGKNQMIPTGSRIPESGYFASIGFAFIMVEVILIQKMTLFLGHPVYSVSVILFSFLLFSGFGAYRSSKETMNTWIFIYLAFMIFGSVFILPKLINVSIGMKWPLKILLSLAILFPFGFLMGRPFPYGLHHLGQTEQNRIPYAYAVNGAFSVLGAVSAMVLGICMGYNYVMVLAALMYGFAGFFARRIKKSSNAV